MGWLAFLGNLPSAFWTSCVNLIKSAGTFIAGVEWQRLINQVADSKKLSEAYKDTLDVEKSRQETEREVSSMSDSAVMDELRTAYGPERRANRRTGQV